MLKNFKILALAFLLIGLFGCSDDETENPTNDVSVWNGSLTSFTKDSSADPNLEENQDRITDNVWITRGASGQIYNAKVETSADKDMSPVGTLWAEGDISNWENLNFVPFREAVEKPQDVVGKNLVMRMVNDKIILSVQFTSWDSGQMGGFSYNRSTP